MMIAQEDDPKVFNWLTDASQHGGGFIAAFARAALLADAENYQILRPALYVYRDKFPKYDRTIPA